MTSRSGKKKTRRPLAPAALPASEGGGHRFLAVAALVVVLLLTTAIRARLLEAPLERDEGEYAYAGQLMLSGVPPYREAYNMKLPGTYAAYALAMAFFGQTTSGIHLGLLVVNLATVVLVFVLARRLMGHLAGVAAAATYALLSLSRSVYGPFAHATHFVVLPALGGILLTMSAAQGTRQWLGLAAGGLLLGLSFLMKQNGLFFILFAAGYLLVSGLRQSPRDWRRLLLRMGVFSLGAALPFAICCLLLRRAGVFERFWFWVFEYGAQYGSLLSLRQGWPLLRTTFGAILLSAPLLWGLAAAGLALLLRRPRTPPAPFVLGLLAVSCAAVCPGFYFREHYFVLLLPAAALLVGAAVAAARDALPGRPWVAAVLLAAALAQGAYTERRLFFEVTGPETSRLVYGANPFLEAVEVADYVRRRTDPEDRIAVIGSEPEIYFYARRRSATGYVYTYSLMEPQKYAATMQQEMIREIESAAPKYAVFVDVPTSWLVGPRSDRAVFDWAARFLAEKYERVGVVDVALESRYVWGPEALTYEPRSPYRIFIHKRKESASGRR